ncbi:CDP-alcohol phosphatidyltransferase [Penicillium longicatenatum]|uniref:CDP-alcohol phosphatidyltransferase n=1 Tax=Penicillium longicatenatum TaxID=1561947 RepID=UPI002547BCF6|nr:CDP-alcohol phosphatidyltransferase [Penicillium longicatenatum]KAJ5631225.1 CDP-alcohol phosphatidyltransferase [Penicillium longicatenatum]
MSRRTSAMASNEPSSVPPSNDGGQFAIDNEPLVKCRSHVTGQEKQKMLLSEEHGHFSMVKALHLADLVTELNGMFLRRQVQATRRSEIMLTVGAVMSVFSSMRYCLGDPSEYGAMWAALAFMPFGLFFDFMDGKIARWRKKSSLMGQELDSLADLVSFGLAPAAAAFALGVRTNVDHLILAFFVLCGLTRLARFNVTVAVLPKDKSGKSKYFEGTPIPTTLYIAGLMAYCVSQSWTHENIPFGIIAEGTALEFHPAALLFVLHGCTMVSKTIHIPKP